MESSCPRSGLPLIVRTRSGERFTPLAAISRPHSLVSLKTPGIDLMETGLRFGRKIVPRLIRLHSWRGRSADEIWRGGRFVLNTARDITLSFSTILMATSLRFVVVNNPSCRNERVG